MSDAPGPIRYARNGGCRLAWQTFGAGPSDLALAWGSPNNIEVQWEWPPLASLLRGYGGLGRVVHWDPRGTGLSDRVAVAELPDLDDRVEDALAVLDAAGMSRVTLIGESEGAPCAVRLAITHPERVERLILIAPALRGLIPDELRAATFELIEQQWGEPILVDFQFPSLADDARFAEWFGRFLRASATPAEARALLELDEQVDEVATLAQVRQPTLVVVHADDPFAPLAEVEAWVELLDEHELAVFPGTDRTFGTSLIDLEILSPIARFLGQDPADMADPDRFERAILFTDIVGSTARAHQLGDEAWRRRLDDHDRAMDALVRRAGGDFLKSTGDGICATLPTAADAVRVAEAAGGALAELDLPIRAGVHLGTIERRGAEIAGIDVHIAARIADLAGDGQVLLSPAAVAALDGTVVLSPAGEHELKGVDGRWSLHALVAER